MSLMKPLYTLLLILPLIILTLNTGWAQDRLDPFTCPVTWYGRMLEMPFGGGLNAPQFHEADLNHDGTPDLVVFDRAGDIVLTYLREIDSQGVVHIKEDRSYADHFPTFTSWMLMRDYNCDGIPDLFTFSQQSKPGFRAYTGRYENDRLTFDPYPVPGTTDNIFTFTLPSGGKAQIYIAFDDIPAFDDIDGDGDLDLITFDPGGGYAHWYRNLSMEQGHGCDSLMFSLVDQCWGRFYESGFSELIDLSPDPSTCPFKLMGEEEEVLQAHVRHAGSTLLTWDLDGKGTKDLFLGDISFGNITLLRNGGTAVEAWMTQQEVHWPENDEPVHMPNFPAAFRVDWDLDGVDDILVAPNNRFGALDTGMVWYYRNHGEEDLVDFRLTRKDVLVGQMLDVGTSSRPAFLDIDGDGLLDMLVGNFGYYDPILSNVPSLAFFRNVGTATEPAFKLEDIDYLGMSAFGPNFIRFYTPAAGDLDGDGDIDLLVGHFQGTMFYYENIAGPGNPVEFAPVVSNYQNLSAGGYCVPQIVDVNGDGLADLLLGAQVGNIRYFQNVGSIGNPVFNPDSSLPPNTTNFGQVDMRKQFVFSAGRAAPWLYQTKDGPEMVVGSNAGDVRRYQVLPDPTAKFPVLDSLYTGYHDGYETSPVMADMDGDGHYEIFIGNLRGGLTAYHTEIEVGTTGTQSQYEAPALNAIFLPGQRVIQLHLPDHLFMETHITLLDILGREVQRWVAPPGISHQYVVPLPPAVYLLRASSPDFRAGVKLAVY